jgi:hypothetical protein
MKSIGMKFKTSKKYVLKIKYNEFFNGIIINNASYIPMLASSYFLGYGDIGIYTAILSLVRMSTVFSGAKIQNVLVNSLDYKNNLNGFTYGILSAVCGFIGYYILINFISTKYEILFHIEILIILSLSIQQISEYYIQLNKIKANNHNTLRWIVPYCTFISIAMLFLPKNLLYFGIIMLISEIIRLFLLKTNYENS